MLQFDPLGRVLQSRQTTAVSGTNYAYPMSYAYNRAGALTSQTYPSGRVVTSEYDPAGRLAGVKNQASNLYYVGAVVTDASNRLQYTAHGAVASMKLGNDPSNPRYEHTNFNSRLQPTEIGLGNTATSTSLLGLVYIYGVVENGTLNTAKNNGNIESQTISVVAS